MPERDARPWSAAWAEASYGPRGFWTDGPGAHHGPAAHFRTSVHAGDVLGGALARLVDEVDRRLGRPDVLDIVDAGAGDGRLLGAVLDALPEDRPVRAVAVDVQRAPDTLDPRIEWRRGDAAVAVPDGIVGVLIAHELLDEVPLDVVEVDTEGRLRLVLVDARGCETLGPDLGSPERCAELGVDAAAAVDWLRRWWWPTRVGERAEVGASRDSRWRTLVSRVRAGTALAVDYGHDASTRARHARGTLAAYADGRRAEPVPDGSVGITAHVALDSLVARGGTVQDQATALRGLGIAAPLPDPSDPDHVASLARTSYAAELLDPAGLGSWGWVRVDV